MILTCPECATSYFVDDSRIPEGGRTVKCTSCGARWHTARDLVQPEPDADLFEEPAENPPAEIETEADAAPQPAADEAPDDDLEVSGPEPASKAPTPRPQAKKPVGAILAWGLMAASVVALVVAALVFRDDVVRLAPQTSGAYAGLGVSVNSLGLVIEDVKTEAVFQGGRPVLAVTGKIRNLREEPVLAPAIRMDLLSAAGRPVAAKIFRPVDPKIPGRAIRHFAVAIEGPPSNLQKLAVAFESPGGGHAVPAAVHADAHAPETGHHPEPAEAQPLPAHAPDALSDHHG
ncbi:DUF3426 domain-containing protein [Phenylobacterium sp.]|jgi:predicted Zn finger-like uncharacterized protein|uniref:DUF3426 domain-containing protein n=1 Tax=Phenylobacterium sp. TaxID=1871053 RepID=UPI002F9327BB